MLDSSDSSMTTVFVAMDYMNDWNMKVSLNAKNSVPFVHLLHTDTRRMRDNGYNILSIKNLIRSSIDEADAILVVAGDNANTLDEHAAEIRADNFLHWGLHYALLCNIKLYCCTINPTSPIPTPLLHENLKWVKYTPKTYVKLLEHIRADVEQQRKYNVTIPSLVLA